MSLEYFRSSYIKCLEERLSLQSCINERDAALKQKETEYDHLQDRYNALLRQSSQPKRVSMSTQTDTKERVASLNVKTPPRLPLAASNKPSKALASPKTKSKANGQVVNPNRTVASPRQSPRNSSQVYVEHLHSCSLI